jgi:hypothetical protein
MADDKNVGRTRARRPADDRRFVGPAGAVFVPHPYLDEDTIASKIASGEWTPVEEPKPAKKAASKKPSNK